MNDLLKLEERVNLALRSLYQTYGYSQFKMSKFETYDLYVLNKDFLVSDGVISFTDTDGTLLALKPDVTLSIVKNYRRDAAALQKVYYSENVYRVSGAAHHFREIMQTGLECMGNISLYDICEVITLAARSLQLISEQYILDISHMQILSDILSSLPLSEEEKCAAMECISQKNEDGLLQLCEGVPQADRLLALCRMSGPITEAVSQIFDLCHTPESLAAAIELRIIADVLQQAGLAERINLDFSIIQDMNYYNGIVFQGYVDSIPTEILSGGQYDKLMEKMGKDASGFGFAVYLDQLERLDNRMKDYDVDALIVYDAEADVITLSQAVAELTEQGLRVLTVQAPPPQLSYRNLYEYQKGRLECIASNG